MDPLNLTLMALLGSLAAGLGFPSPQTVPPPQAQAAYDTPTRSPPPPSVIIRTPVGRQFFILGLQSSYWIGTGSISTLDANGNMDASLGNFTDHAVGIGPVYLGLLHVITPRLFFEARAGVGAVWFANDRLISSDLSAQGDSHLGIQFGAELRARTATPSGLTGSLGLNLSRVNLPNSNGGFLGISPTLGYLSWDAGYRGFWLVEVGYSYPLINGMNPEFGDSSFDPPIDATWQQLTLSIGFGY